MSNLSVRPIAPQEQRYFEPYLLPQAVQEMHSSPYTLLGAFSGTLACGAAAVRRDGETAVLSSLFIDPLVRGQGLGGALTDMAVQLSREQGAACLTCDFVLNGEDLTAMKALLRRRGGNLRYWGPAYCVDVSAYCGKRFVGAALRSDFRSSPSVVSFSQLTQEQSARLEARSDIPMYLRWKTCAHTCTPDLSLAWIQAGQVSAYLLGGPDGGSGYVLAAAWRGEEAQGISFPILLREHLNLCWFRSGGRFLYYFSAITPPAQALAQRLLQGNYQEYAQMSAKIEFPHRSAPAEEAL